LFKKGDPASCENYRPICILSIAYKLFAWILKERLIQAGVDKVLWRTQFGFRQGCSTDDAIFIARRLLEVARAQRHGKITMLALDWRKAFDSINVDSLIDALRRFGIPHPILNLLRTFLRNRTFSVKECGVTSALHHQQSGISQGCTLSPLLFIIAMTVLLHDAVEDLGAAAKAAYRCGDLGEIVYADDTLLYGSIDAPVTEYLRAVQGAGRRYGLELHTQKFQLLSTDPACRVFTTEGVRIPLKSSMEYLGAILTADGSNCLELNRRIGAAKGDFVSLCKIWSHSSLTWRGKLRIFSAVVESKLMYALARLTFTVADLRRLDGFQNRCIRKIIGVKPSFVSRISNASVLSKADHTPTSALLQKRRLQLFGKIVRQPPGHPSRQACFIGDTLIPTTERFVRRVGRPHAEWARVVLQEACQLFGSSHEAGRAAMDRLI
jgi:hypothetical protein